MLIKYYCKNCDHEYIDGGFALQGCPKCKSMSNPTMRDIKDVDDKELNKAVVDALGWTHEVKHTTGIILAYDVWIKPNGGKLGERPYFATDLTQAFEHIVPHLNKMNLHEYWYHIRDEILYYDYPQTKTSDWQSIEGKGSNTGERFAWGLCKLLLKVVNNDK